MTDGELNTHQAQLFDAIKALMVALTALATIATAALQVEVDRDKARHRS